MQLLERHNPEISFDWPRLLKASAQAPGATAPHGAHVTHGLRDERRQRRDRRDQRPRHEPPAAAPSVPEFAQPDPATPDAFDAQGAAEVTEYSEYTEYIDLSADSAADPSSASAAAGEEALEPSEPVEPIESAAPFEAAPPSEPIAAVQAQPQPEEPLPERYARLGVEGLSRLRSRYADLVGRLAARQLDPVDQADSLDPLNAPASEQRAQMLARVERLNPDRWLTAEEVAAALEEYETVFESLRGVIGRPARRGRL